jgi:dTDP-glucose 4,6-dehydratase
LRILVTGGMGFIGSNFIHGVLSKHKEVQVSNVDKLSYGANSANLQSYQKDRRYVFSRGDITDQDLIGRLVRDIDVIVNFAAESHVDRSIADPWPFLRSNTEGVLSVLEAMRRNGGDAKLIQVSTDEVYGDVRQGSADEDAKLNPSSPYAASKAAADMLCLAYWRTYGLKVSMTRCTNNFGPYQFPEKLLPKTVIRAQMNLKVPVYGRGKNVRDWIYVTDHCEALELVLKKGKAGQVYNIAGHNELQNGKMVKMILQEMGAQRGLIEFVEDRPGHDIRYRLDDKKIRWELGWRPRHSLKSALRNTVAWYLENQDWWRPLANEQVLSPSPWKINW